LASRNAAPHAVCLAPGLWLEPRLLPHSDFWKSAARQPQHDTSSSLKVGLTVPRFASHNTPAVDQRKLAIAQARALVALASAAGSSVSATREPLLLVGAGRVVRDLHVPALQLLDEHPVVAVVDTDADAARYVADQLHSARHARRSMISTSQGLQRPLS
jgi:hypothetical protein